MSWSKGKIEKILFSLYQNLQEIELSKAIIENFNNEVKVSLNSSRDKNITNVNCPHCKFSSTSSSKLKVHLKSCHTRPGLVSPENRKQIKLNNGALCVKAITPERPKLATSSVLMQEVLDLIQCKFCDFDTADTEELDNHIKVKHTQSGFECTDCDKKFKSESDYSIHNKEAHTFNCDLCSKTFSSEAMVSEHFTTTHYVTSPFLCVKCDHQTIPKNSKIRN